MHAAAAAAAAGKLFIGRITVSPAAGEQQAWMQARCHGSTAVAQRPGPPPADAASDCPMATATDERPVTRERALSIKPSAESPPLRPEPMSRWLCVTEEAGSSAAQLCAFVPARFNCAFIALCMQCALVVEERASTVCTGTQQHFACGCTLASHLGVVLP